MLESLLLKALYTLGSHCVLCLLGPGISYQQYMWLPWRLAAVLMVTPRTLLWGHRTLLRGHLDRTLLWESPDSPLGSPRSDSPLGSPDSPLGSPGLTNSLQFTHWHLLNLGQGAGIIMLCCLLG